MNRVGVKRVLLLCVVTVFAAVAAVVFHFSGAEAAACEAADGKWAPVTETCITRSCFATQSCGEWVNPGARCPLLKNGDSRAEVYFQLGMPKTASASSASWQLDKASAQVINARFDGDLLASLSCPVPSP